MFQPRVVAAIGSALSGFGLILSSMSNQLWQIIVAYGLVGKILSVKIKNEYETNEENLISVPFRSCYRPWIGIHKSIIIHSG